MNLDMYSVGVVVFGISFFLHLSISYLCNPLLVECQAEGELIAEVFLDKFLAWVVEEVFQSFQVSHHGFFVQVVHIANDITFVLPMDVRIEQWFGGGQCVKTF